MVPLKKLISSFFLILGFISSPPIDEGLPEPRRRPLCTSVYFDSDHIYDQVTRRSVSGVMYFAGSTPIIWTSKRQVTDKSSSYCAKFCEGRVATVEAIAFRYMLRS